MCMKGLMNLLSSARNAINAIVICHELEEVWLLRVDVLIYSNRGSPDDCSVGIAPSGRGVHVTRCPKCKYEYPITVIMHNDYSVTLFCPQCLRLARTRIEYED